MVDGSHRISLRNMLTWPRHSCAHPVDRQAGPHSEACQQRARLPQPALCGDGRIADAYVPQRGGHLLPMVRPMGSPRAFSPCHAHVLPLIIPYPSLPSNRTIPTARTNHISTSSTAQHAIRIVRKRPPRVARRASSHRVRDVMVFAKGKSKRTDGSGHPTARISSSQHYFYCGNPKQRERVRPAPMTNASRRLRTRRRPLQKKARRFPSTAAAHVELS